MAFESTRPTSTRLRDFALWQAPTLIASALALFGMAITKPIWLREPHVVLGFALIVAASAATLLPAWRDGGSAVRILVPLADVLGVGSIRAEVFTDFSAVGLLSMLPLVWLAFEFGSLGVVLSIVGSMFVSGYGYVVHDALPTTGVQWLQVIAYPVVAVALAIMAQFIARALAGSRQALLDRSAALARALRAAEDTVVLGEGILQTIDAAVAYYDAEGSLRMSNDLADKFAAKAGVGRKRSPGDVDLVWHADQRTPIPPADQLVPRALRGDPLPSDVVWLGPPGDQIGVMSSARQLRRDDGELIGTVIAAWDVTELMEAVRVREEFLATVSHELRTPLTSIIGYLELLDEEVGTARAAEDDSSRRPVDPDKLYGRLTVIRRNADTLLQRISHLLDASESYVSLQPADTDLGELVANAIERHLPAASDAGVLVEEVRAPGIRACVDPVRFEQVVDNLLSNAIKYTPQGGLVSVELDKDPDRVVLTIADTGIGMTPSEQRQAFEKFYRAEAARRSATQGIGVGLAIVNEVIDAHRGTVRLDSRPGAGTTVRITLPAA